MECYIIMDKVEITTCLSLGYYLRKIKTFYKSIENWTKFLPDEKRRNTCKKSGSYSQNFEYVLYIDVSWNCCFLNTSQNIILEMLYIAGLNIT